MSKKQEDLNNLTTEEKVKLLYEIRSACKGRKKSQEAELMSQIIQEFIRTGKKALKGHKYSFCTSSEKDDIIQEALIKLYLQVLLYDSNISEKMNYDPDKVKFTPYVYNTIKFVYGDVKALYSNYSNGDRKNYMGVKNLLNKLDKSGEGLISEEALINQLMEHYDWKKLRAQNAVNVFVNRIRDFIYLRSDNLRPDSLGITADEFFYEHGYYEESLEYQSAYVEESGRLTFEEFYEIVKSEISWDDALFYWVNSIGIDDRSGVSKYIDENKGKSEFNVRYAKIKNKVQKGRKILICEDDEGVEYLPDQSVSRIKTKIKNAIKNNPEVKNLLLERLRFGMEG